jgi:hypothetical protein
VLTMLPAGYPLTINSSLTATPSHNWLIFPDGPRYTVLVWTAQKTPLPVVPLLLRVHPLPGAGVYRTVT